MKVILSRKGADSSNGGIPSPIFPDGTMFSIPIPSGDAPTYGDIAIGSDGSLLCSDFLAGIRKSALAVSHCHVDPDIVQRYAVKPEGWKPAFGQCGAAQGYLRNTAGVKPGDLFLFFGNFKAVSTGKTLSYRARPGIPGATVPDGEIQIIWGYLQIGEILTEPVEIKEYCWHPHAGQAHLDDSNNALYVPTRQLSFCKEMPGCGVFNFSERRTLTLSGANKATWKANPVYLPQNVVGNRQNSARGEGIYYAGIWQELCLAESIEAENWARLMVCGSFFTHQEKQLLRRAAQLVDCAETDSGWLDPKPAPFDVLTHIEDDRLDEQEIAFLRSGIEWLRREAVTDAEGRTFAAVSSALDRYQATHEQQ